MTDEPDQVTRHTDPWAAAENQEHAMAAQPSSAPGTISTSIPAGAVSASEFIRGGGTIGASGRFNTAGAMVPEAPRVKEPTVTKLTTAHPKNPVKPGLFTSEFWAAVVLPWVVTAADNQNVIAIVPERYRFVLAPVAMLATGFYALSRGRAKSGT